MGAVDSMPHKMYDTNIMEVQKMAGKYDYQEKWKTENTERVTIRFQKTTDADILQWLELRGSSTAGEIKRLMRIAIGLLQNSEPEHSAVESTGAVEEEE